MDSPKALKAQKLIRQGNSYHEVAKALHIGVSTVYQIAAFIEWGQPKLAHVSLIERMKAGQV
ncbi:helix-turn-helix domain-containing protein [Maritalea myrionectae]|nr:helix-turn-helix domain-containing protein [Maritalea myrionectae]